MNALLSLCRRIGLFASLCIAACAYAQSTVPVDISVSGYVDPTIDYTPDTPQGYLRVSATLVPTTPTGDGFRTMDSWGTAGDSLNAAFWPSLVNPGKVYDLTIEGDYVDGDAALVQVTAPPGYQVILDGKPRPVETVSSNSHVLLVIVPTGQDPTLAGYASSISVNRIDWRLGLGTLINGDSAGSIGLIDTGTDAQWTGLYTPGRLYYQSTSDDVWTYSESGALRQIVARQIAIDVVTIDAATYEIRCYTPAQIVSPQTTPRQFTGQPYVTYRIGQMTPESTDSTAVAIKFTKETRNVTDATSSPPVTRREFMTLERTGSWPNFHWTKRDWYQEGSSPVSETVVQSSMDSNQVRTEAIAVRPYGSTTPTLSVTRTYKIISGVGEMFASETLGTSNTAPTTIDYYSNGYGASVASIKTAVMPGGRWASFSYGYLRNQVKWEYHPFLNTPTAPQQVYNQGEVVYYDYANDIYGTPSRIARATTDVDGVATKSVGYGYTDYSMSSYYAGYTFTQKSETSGSTGGLTTMVHSYRDDYPDSLLRGQVVSVRGPDGSTTGYLHQNYGSQYIVTKFTGYVPGPYTSSPPSGMPLVRLDSPDYLYAVVGKSTKEVTTRDSRGLVTREEKWICVGSGDWSGPYWQQVSWTNYTYNFYGLLTDRVSSDGTTYHAVYDGQLKTSETDELGITTTYTYDAAERVATTTRAGSGPVPSLKTTYQYDAMGAVVSTTVGPDAGEQIVTSTTYDDAGRVRTTTGPGGFGATTQDYDPVNRTHTVTRAGAGSVTETSYLDGRLYSKTGSGIVAEYHTYDRETDGRSWERVDYGSPSSARWTKTWTDGFGNAVSTEQPGFNGAADVVTEKFYDTVNSNGGTGHLYRSTTPGPGTSPLVTRYDYDILGQPFRSGLDVDDNGLVPASNDRIAETNAALESYAGAYWWRQDSYTYPQANSGTAVSTGFTRQRLTGFTGTLVAETQTGDADGNLTIKQTTIDPTTATKTITTTTTGVANAKVETYRAGLLVSVTTSDGLTTTTGYDSLLRPSTVTDSRGNVTTTAYISGTSLVQTVTDATNTVVSTSHYDAAGRKDWQQDANGKRTYFAYNPRDQVIRQWGPATYPFEYAYDNLGEKVAMRTFRNPTQDFTTSTWPLSDDGADPSNPDPGSWTTGDKTTWTYDAGSGLLASKTDASNKSVAYTYTASGKLATRDWARLVASGPNAGQHVRTTYTYDPATGDQTDISYNDGTPSLHYTYTRLAQLDTVTDAKSGVHDFIYDPSYPHRLSAEAFDTFYGQRVVTRLYDSTGVLGRPTGFQLGSAVGSNSDLEQEYGYAGDSGRFTSVTSVSGTYSTRTFRYGYEPNSALLKTLWTDDTSFYVTRSFEPNRDVLTSIDTKWGQNAATSITKYTYHSNLLAQRDSKVQSGDAFTAYAGSDHAIHQTFTYNDRGELNQAPTYTGSTTTDTSGPLANRQYEYSYDAIGNRLWAGLTGNSADRKNYGSNALNQITSRDNSDTPFTGSQSYTYDDDGNVTSDGLWSYTWDAENRLITMVATTTAVNAGQPNLWIDFGYDYLGRRVEKKVTNLAANGGVIVWKRFLYDGWNLIAEYDVSAPSMALTMKRSYTWGLDIALSMTNAGGVGALLQIADSPTGQTYVPTYDGNGNVVTLLNAGTGAVAATYEYSPYGEALGVQISDSTVADNPFGFSTKWTDLETGLVYYGHRYYRPSVGDFINRDPIEESGGLNLYGFCVNNAINQWDVLGNIPSLKAANNSGYTAGYANVTGGVGNFILGLDGMGDAGNCYLKPVAPSTGSGIPLGALNGAILFTSGVDALNYDASANFMRTGTVTVGEPTTVSSAPAPTADSSTTSLATASVTNAGGVTPLVDVSTIDNGSSAPNTVAAPTATINVITEIRPPYIEAGVKSNQTVVINTNNGQIVSSNYSTGTTQVFGIDFSARQLGTNGFSATSTLQNGSTYVTLTGETGSKFVPLNINYNFTVGYNPNTQSAIVLGTHNGFPSYVVTVNGTQVLNFQQTGGVLNLAGSGGVIVVVPPTKVNPPSPANSAPSPTP